MSELRISKASGTWVVRAFGSVIGETSEALVVSEPGHDDVIYFPRSDIAMEFLEPSKTQTTCPRKGQASYFGISTTEGLKDDSAWSYEAPIEAASDIEGYLAFYSDKVTVEQL